MKMLNRQVFLALATVAWADGSLAPEERDGILSAARGAGFAGADLTSLEQAIQSPVALSSLSLRKLSALDRVFIRGGVTCTHHFCSRLALAKQASDHLPVIVDLELEAG